MDPILELLQKDARLTPSEIARMTRKKVADVQKRIRAYEKQGVILGYKAIVNSELLHDVSREVRALIEVKVAPQKDLGFDKVAERIFAFPEVTSCYLLSGSYDLLLVVEGKDLRTVSRFVAEKLSPMEHVRGTVTHFLLKKYKEHGIALKCLDEDRRLAISY
jgi:DNA-binding Lrp family transcriptional regulator